MTQTPQEWLEEFFLKPNRPLERADRSALYKYRTSDTEFADLKRVLKTHTEHRLWNKLFVLYAAEWWQQNFKGGHWAWKPIFDSLNMRQSVTDTQRGNDIKDGLACWERKVHKVNNKQRFLATIVIEGGLPIQTVANNTSWLKKILCDSFGVYLRQSARNPETLYTLIEGKAEEESIPTSLKKEGVYDLLRDIVVELVRLKEKHNLGDSPVEFLDIEDPEWRDNFPLPINSSVGLKFIDDLLSEAAKVKPEPQPKNPFQVKRILQETPDGWQITAKIKLPDTALIEPLQLLEEDMLSRMQIVLKTSLEMNEDLGYAFKITQNGQSVLKLFAKSAWVSGPHAIASINLCLYAKQPVMLPLTKGESLEDDLPWVFVENDGKWNYIGQASQSVSAEAALVVVKDDLHPRDSTLEPIGTVLGDRIIYKICGEATFENKEGKFRVRTTVTDAGQEEYVLLGARAPFISKPSWVYFGPPRLTLQDEKGYKNCNGMEVKTKGRNTEWQSLNDTHHGVVSLRFKDSDGYIVFRKHIAILPADFNLSLRADGTTPTRGDIIIENAGGFHAHIADKAINATITESEEQIKIALHSADAMPPERVRLHLGNIRGEDITFTLPFPANGIRAFDGKNRPLSNDSSIFLDQIRGIRLHLFNGQKGQVGNYEIKMNLVDETLPNISDIYFADRDWYSKGHLEISLANYLDKIRRLLSVSNNLKAFANLRVSLLGGKNYTLNIHQYSGEIEKNPQSGCASLKETKAEDDLDGTVVLAVPVNQLEQTPASLAPLKSEGAHRASWDFLPQTRAAGPWVIYPDKLSAVQFCPLHWPLGDSSENKTATTLQKAVGIQDANNRMIAIKQLINTMATDFDHQGWHYIDMLWDKMGHLPLATFDIWKAFADNPHALVALLFHGEDELLGRIPEEFPVMWELIPMCVWLDVFSCYYRHIENKHSATGRDKIIKPKLHYIEVMLDMENLSRILASSLGINQQKQNLTITDMKKHFIDAYQGIEGYPGLLSRHITEDDWPPFLRPKIAKEFSDLPMELRDLIPQERDVSKPVANLPMILAHESVMGTQKTLYDPIQVFKIKSIRDFDLEWFYFVFNAAQQCWYHQHQKG